MIPDNNVIQQGNAEHFARPPDLPCHGNVVTAWFRDSAWMVVNQQNMNRTERGTGSHQVDQDVKIIPGFGGHARKSSRGEIIVALTVPLVISFSPRS